MHNNEISDQNLSTEKLAENITTARVATGKSIKEISTLLGIPTSRLKNYEQGKYIPSLPEVEALSYIYRIPVFAFFQEGSIDNFAHVPVSDQIQKLLRIRQQIIGTRIHLARENSEISLKQLSKITKLPTSRIKRYEEGESPIPYDELGKIAAAIGLDLGIFFDHDSPIGKWQKSQFRASIFEELPEEVQDFISDASKNEYLKIAQNISTIGIDKFTSLSDSLSDLTSSFNDKNASND